MDAAFLAAQMEFTAPKKTTANEFTKSNYADLTEVLAACLPALHKHGFAVQWGYVVQDGHAYVQTRLSYGDEGISTSVPIMGAQNMQQLGSAITYARRYGLLMLTGLAPEDDDGNATGSNRTTNPPPSTPKQKVDKPSVKQIMSDIGKARHTERLDEIEAWVKREANTSKDHLLAVIAEKREQLTDPGPYDE